MVKLLYLSAAGAAGTLARYGLQGLVHRWSGSAFPWGTLAVNVLGCFLFGTIWALAAERGILSPQTRTICLIGFMGAFTTFSSYVFETSQLMMDRQWLAAAGNFAMENLFGLSGLLAGLWLGRWL
jgi:fluoride exporter